MSIGRYLIALGMALILLGCLFLWGDKLRLGRLPGDISIQGEHYSFHFPIVTCLILSVLLSAVLWIIRQFRG